MLVQINNNALCVIYLLLSPRYFDASVFENNGNGETGRSAHVGVLQIPIGSHPLQNLVMAARKRFGVSLSSCAIEDLPIFVRSRSLLVLHSDEHSEALPCDDSLTKFFLQHEHFAVFTATPTLPISSSPRKSLIWRITWMDGKLLPRYQ